MLHRSSPVSIGEIALFGKLLPGPALICGKFWEKSGKRGKTAFPGKKRMTDFISKLEDSGQSVTAAEAFASTSRRWFRDVVRCHLRSGVRGGKNPFHPAILRILVHTVFMTELATCARRLLFTKCCPRRDQLKLGPMDKNAISTY